MGVTRWSRSRRRIEAGLGEGGRARQASPAKGGRCRNEFIAEGACGRVELVGEENPHGWRKVAAAAQPRRSDDGITADDG